MIDQKLGRSQVVECGLLEDVCMAVISNCLRKKYDSVQIKHVWQLVFIEQSWTVALAHLSS